MKTVAMSALAALLGATLLLGSLSAPQPARATPFLVNSTEDAPDAVPGDAICATLSGVCTLRGAIMEANMLPGADTITVPAGTYRLTIPGRGGDFGENGDLDIRGELSIVGAGAASTIVDAGGLDRVFETFTATLPSRISGMTIRGGDSGSGDGGGIQANAPLTLSDVAVTANTSGRFGGGVSIAGGASLTVIRASVSNNTSGDNGGGVFYGGPSPLTIVESTFSGNRSVGGARKGGGLYTGGPALLRNVTFSGNQAGEGGGVAAEVGGLVSLLNVTVNGNSGVGGVFGTLPQIQLKNSLIVGNPPRNCEGAGAPLSMGNNLDDDGSCFLGGPGDLSNNPNARVGPLANNGGPTQTHALLTGSAAVDAGSNDGCPQTDQRGVARPQDGDGNGSAICDIGAFEVGSTAPASPTSTATSTPVATATPSQTPTSTATVVPTGTPTALSGSLLLDGATAYAEAPHAPELAVNDWSLEVWFLDANPNFNHPRTRIVTKGEISSPEVPFFASVDGNLLYVGLRSGGIGRTLTISMAGVTPNVWHHLAATFQASTRTLAIYLDGTQRLQQVLASASTGNSLPLIMGRSGTSGDYWRGKLDDLRLWNVVRTASEIQTNYQTELIGSPAGLVGNWRFNEGVGATAADSAGAAQNATLRGGATWSTEHP